MSNRRVRVYHYKKRIRRILLMMIDQYEVRCYFCKFRITLRDFPVRRVDNVSIHHVDHNSSNNDIGNLALAHRYCHKRYHILYQRRRNKWVNKCLYVNNQKSNKSLNGVIQPLNRKAY